MVLCSIFIVISNSNQQKRVNNFVLWNEYSLCESVRYMTDYYVLADLGSEKKNPYVS